MTHGQARAGRRPDPPGAKPLDLEYMRINGFPKAVGLWWVQGKALVLAFTIGQSLEGLVLAFLNYQPIEIFSFL